MQCYCYYRDEYEVTLMNQRKMFDDELDEMTVQHCEAIDKLKRMHSDEKNKVEQLLQHQKENTDHVGGTKKEAARYIEKRRRFYLR